jgi:2-ketocyclohexanecarboxyl-CoA hydrolase
MDYQHILYTESNGVATIAINRPEVYNAFSAQTLDEMIDAFRRAEQARTVRAIVLTGTGDKAFCTGGDQSVKDGGYGGRGVIGLPIDELHSAIRDSNKPVIARVNGFAIGGGNVLVTLCDLAIASDTAQLGQVGPRVGSFDAGFGTAYLARVIGEKKAREMWFLCRRYNAQQALEMGLVNAVVPADRLDEEVAAWCAEIVGKSPTALAFLKRSFNVDTEMIRGVSQLALQGLALYYDTDESKEGGNAFREKRSPDFNPYVR